MNNLMLLGRDPNNGRRVAGTALLITVLAGIVITDLAEAEFAVNAPRPMLTGDTLMSDGESARHPRGLRALSLNGGLTDADSLIVAQATDNDEERRGSIRLGPINVEGQRESAYGPVDGYVAGRSATGSKTDTPLLELPQSISVITRDRIDAQDVDSVQEALRYTPGVTGEAFGVDTRLDFLQIRGFTATETGLFRDGLILRSRSFSSFRLDPYLAERIEVFRGPSSVLYGQTNPGGFINFVTKRPTSEPAGEVELEVGNDDRYQGKFDVGGPLGGSETVFYRMTGLAREADTQVDFVEDDRKLIAPSLTWAPTADTTLTLLSHYQDDSTGAAVSFLPFEGTIEPNPNGDIPFNRFTGEPGFDHYDRTQYSLGYLLEHRLGDAWTLRQNTRYDHLDLDYRTLSGGGLDLEADPSQRTLARSSGEVLDDTDVFAIDNQAQVNFDSGPLGHTMLFGLDYQRFDYDEQIGFGDAPSLDLYTPVYGQAVTPPELADNNLEQHQIGVYLQDQIKVREKWNVLLGGRYDRAQSDVDGEEQDDNEFTGRAGLVYLADNGLAPYVSYSESFLPTQGSNALEVPFEPETGQQYEFGVKYQPPGANAFVTVAAFDLRRQNVRTTDPDNPLNEIQTGEIRSRGVEVESVASFDFGLDLIAAYTYLDPEITESEVMGEEGEQPVGVPEHTASLWADYKVRGGMLAGVGFGGGVRYLGSQSANLPNTLDVPDTTLVDALIHYDWGNYQFALNAQNLFDEEYVSTCDGAPVTTALPARSSGAFAIDGNSAWRRWTRYFTAGGDRRPVALYHPTIGQRS